MQKQKGFSLAELVIIIAIIGILSASALPNFVNVTSISKINKLNGLAGGLRSTVTLARSEYLAAENKAANTVRLDGQLIMVLSEKNAPGRGGHPIQSARGIGVAVTNLKGFDVNYTGAYSTYTPKVGGNSNCQIRYDADRIGEPVQVITSGC